MDFFQQLFRGLGDAPQFLIPLLAAIVGLFVAWVIARIGAFLVRKGLEKLQLDERASRSLDTKTQITNGSATSSSGFFLCL